MRSAFFDMFVSKLKLVSGVLRKHFTARCSMEEKQFEGPKHILEAKCFWKLFWPWTCCWECRPFFNRLRNRRSTGLWRNYWRRCIGRELCDHCQSAIRSVGARHAQFSHAQFSTTYCHPMLIVCCQLSVNFHRRRLACNVFMFWQTRFCDRF